mmetsp:Transcript_19475/g.31529  ORF Transcript_19475/g.31529 Transcript_19475/m.31529 type:complete len:289 (+) Transcript_19475:999-1865(+)
MCHVSHHVPPLTTRPARTSHPVAAAAAAAAADVAVTSTTRPAVVILPGLGNCSEDYEPFAAELEARGFSATTARVARPDWLRNAAGLTSAAYWRGTLEPRPTVDWYLERIAAAVIEAKAASGSSRVTICAHSAGGWMARVYLKDFGVTDVASFVSLGSPLNAVPKGVRGVVDQTRGILTYVEANCAPADELGIPVTCIAGKWLEGTETFSGVDEAGRFLVGQGYKQVCGSAAAWGDGITPVAAAHLQGAENVTLEGVFHSPVGSSPSRPWYGTPEVLDQWVDKLRSAA